ncbi:MAG: hypothetical protein ACAI44_39385 [Candidatus Sericytochromatia bacterium]
MGLDLGTLAVIEDMTERQSHLRHATSARLTAYGLDCLQNAQQDGFHDRELLVEACEALLDAIRYDRARLEPYLGMGYLLWLLGEYQQARDYLSEALTLAPDNADAQTLLQALQASLRQASPPRQAILPPLSPLPSKDFDRWYDEVEREIKTEIQTISRIPPASFAISDDRLRIEALERRYADLLRAQARILAQCEQIEAEIDCAGLRSMLRPIEIVLARCHTSLSASWQLVELGVMLEAHRQWLEHSLAQFEAAQGLMPPEFTQERFEYLLEDCDTLADQIDALDQSQPEISALIAAYEDLVQKVTQLQDVLDQT